MRRSGAFGALRAALALTIMLPFTPVVAQGTFSLPPGSASPSSGPAGPVDPDNPVVTTRPRPTPTAAPSPTVTLPPPSASPTPTGPATPTAARTAAPATRVQPGRATQPAAIATPTILPTTSATATTPPASEATVNPAPFPTALPAAPATAAPVRSGTDIGTDPATLWRQWWPLAAGAGIILALIGLLGWWRSRRRRAEAEALAFEPPEVAPSAPPPVPTPAPAAAPSAPAQSPAAAPQPAPAPTETSAPVEGLGIALVARRLDASLMATTLSYEVTLTNHGAAPLGAVAVEGDLVAAHASLPVEQQIAQAGQRLELRHALVELAPGESATFKGELRLPLSAITPIRAGNAAYFVPLVRLRLEAAQSASDSLQLAQTYVIGELPDQPGGALRPFRLDLGPRTFARLGQRAVG